MVIRQLQAAQTFWFKKFISLLSFFVAARAPRWARMRPLWGRMQPLWAITQPLWAMFLLYGSRRVRHLGPGGRPRQREPFARRSREYKNKLIN